LRPNRFFYFQLAEELGLPVKALLDTISSKELTEWKAYYKLKKKMMDKDNKKGNKEINKHHTF
jgi:hypothetical protein